MQTNYIKGETYWDVEKTTCYPCEWYGGPYFNGIRQSNSTCYFFRTHQEAESYVNKQRSRS
jgi:hypothetical protein